jgi:HKD family nuclease
MLLTTSGSALRRELIKLIEKHDNVAIAVAWASAGTDVYEALRKNKNKIHRVVIGTHFYQTHPDVLEDFIGCNEVRFVLQPQGVFHPKAYLFWGKKSWDILVGSANLTAGAMGRNSELMIHISSTGSPSDIHLQLKNQIEEYWEQGEVVTAQSVSAYRALWKTQQQALKRVSGAYSSGTKSKAPIHTEIMSMSWSSFFKAVKADPFHGFDKRCDLLDLVRNAFKESTTYSTMELGLRKTIAGLPNDVNVHWGWFGSMRGAGYFHQAVNNNNPHLSAALDFIPLNGAIAREHYENYISEFVRAFPDGRDGVSLASRLLALKRPDYFVCLDSKNKTKLCKDFGIKQAGMTYERYWDDVVCRIVDSVWWNEPKPSDKIAARVWMGRAAMLDAIFYQP